MQRIFELANSKTMPLVNFGPDGLVESLENLKNKHNITTTVEDKAYLGHMMRDISDIADVIVRDYVGNKLSKYGIESVGCYCVKGNEWVMEVEINEDRCALNGLYWWETFVENEKCKKYVSSLDEAPTYFDVVGYIAMAMIVEGLIDENLESQAQKILSDTVSKNIDFEKYYMTSNEKWRNNDKLVD